MHILKGSTCFLMGYQSHPWKALHYKPQTPSTKHPHAKTQLKTPNHNEGENMRIKYKTLAKSLVASLSCISIGVSGEPKISGLSLLLWIRNISGCLPLGLKWITSNTFFEFVDNIEQLIQGFLRVLSSNMAFVLWSVKLISVFWPIFLSISCQVCCKITSKE